MIFILLYSQVGYYFVLRNSQENIKEEMREKVVSELKTSEMEVISLTEHRRAISWEENGNEFSFNGQMFDLVKTANENGQIVLYCLNDVKEKQLVDKYNELTKHNSSNKQENTNIDSINLFVEGYAEEHIPFTLLVNKIYLSFASHLQSSTLKNSTPPPKAYLT